MILERARRSTKARPAVPCQTKPSVGAACPR